MNNQPSVSILVPFYNVEKYIERCARSLFEQTYENIEYVFVDDGSTDDSLAVLKKLISEYSHREPHVQIFSFPVNKGLATARNYLVDHCQTDWLLHVDADDWVEHDLVAHLVEKQQETGADIVISNYLKHGNGYVGKYNFKDYHKKTDFLKLFLSDMGAHNIWGRLIRLSLYVSNSIRVSTDCVIAEDLRAFIRLAYYANLISVLNEYGYHYETRREERITNKNRENIRRKGFGLIDTLSDVRVFVSEKMPELIDTYESNICLSCYDEYLYKSVLFDNRELHKAVSRKHGELICKYPFLKGSIKSILKRHLKYNFWIYSFMLR